jgi:hypothetical protein
MENVRTRTEENPHGIQQVPLHSVKVMVWCAASSQQITDLIYSYLQETVILDW